MSNKILDDMRDVMHRRHKDVKTTMIYTHILQQSGEGVISPLEDL